jgi:tetratricopeptide (TPR) repeat protein
LNLLSGALIEPGSYAEAEKIKREEIALLEGLRGGDYPEYSTNFPMSLESLGFILAERQKFEEAEDVYRKALSYREGVYGPKHKAVATSLVNLGDLYLRQEKLAESEVMSRRALSLLGEAFESEELKHSDIPVFLRAARNLARVDVESKRYAEAEKTYKFVVEAVEKFYGRSDPSLIEPLEEYAALLRAMKRPAEGPPGSRAVSGCSNGSSAARSACLPAPVSAPVTKHISDLDV